MNCDVTIWYAGTLICDPVKGLFDPHRKRNTAVMPAFRRWRQEDQDLKAIFCLSKDCSSHLHRKGPHGCRESQCVSKTYRTYRPTEEPIPSFQRLLLNSSLLWIRLERRKTTSGRVSTGERNIKASKVNTQTDQWTEGHLHGTLTGAGGDQVSLCSPSVHTKHELGIIFLLISLNNSYWSYIS